VYLISEPADYLLFAPEYGVMVSGKVVGDTMTMWVWSLEVHPTILTDPEAMAETKSGQVVPYRVRVMGDDNDPAVGELVDWQLIGAGMLLDIQSKTDDDGYATTRVQYGLAETGESVVKASVLC
jgi:hypothetical protein